jgi:cyclically-permuted mutarotase family protein
MKSACTALICILFLFVTIPGKLMSQKQALNKINWSLAASIPSQPGALPQPGLAGSVSGISNNVLIIAGGANFPGGLPWTGAVKVYHDDIYLFEKNNSSIKAPNAPCRQKLPEAVAYGGSVSTPGGIIYAGGENEQGITDKVYRLQYDAAARNIIIQPLPSLPLPLTNLSAAWYNNKLFIAGGESNKGPSQKFLFLDLARTNAQWQSLPDVPWAVTHAVLVAQSDGDHACLYLSGGRKKNTDGISTIYAHTFCYDLKANEWRPKQSLPYPLSAASGIARGANYILLLGGDKGEVFSAVEILAVKINAAKDARERDTLVKQKNELLAAHPGFNKDILLYNTITDTWVNIGRFPYAPVATATALNWGGDIIIPSGEIRAGVRTPHIIKGELQKKDWYSKQK